MEWSDEHYVKLYTRDTLTWRSWKWETRTVFLHLLKGRLDGSGFIETGAMDPIDALTLQLELPREVVGVGLAQLLACGTAMLVDRAILIPRYLAAQEARKSEAQKKRDFRERTIARRQAAELPRQHVPTTEPTGTKVDPPALPCPAQPKKTAGKKPPAVPKATDPRHSLLTKALCDAYEAEAKAKYPFSGQDAKAVTELLSFAEPAEVEVRWRRALRRSDFPTVRAIHELRRHWPHFVAQTLPTKGAAWQQPGATDWDNHPTSFLEGLSGDSK